MLYGKLVAVVAASLLVATILAACAVKQRTSEGTLTQDVYTWPQKPIAPETKQ